MCSINFYFLFFDTTRYIWGGYFPLASVCTLWVSALLIYYISDLSLYRYIECFHIDKNLVIITEVTCFFRTDWFRLLLLVCVPLFFKCYSPWFVLLLRYCCIHFSATILISGGKLLKYIISSYYSSNLLRSDNISFSKFSFTFILIPTCIEFDFQTLV